MKVIPKGRLAMGAVRAVFPYQEQPEICVPDILPNAARAHAGSLSRMRIDPVAGCAHAQHIFVPYNQLLRVPHDLGARVKDGGTDGAGAYIKAGIPHINWTELATEHIANNVIVHYFRGEPSGHQYFDVLWDGTGQDYNTEWWSWGVFWDGVTLTTRTTDVQGFTAVIERGLPQNMDPARPSECALGFVILGYLYTLGFTHSEKMYLLRATHDPANPTPWGEDRTYMSAQLSVGVDTTKVLKSTGGQGGIPVDVRYLNGIVQIAVGTPSNVFAFKPAARATADGKPCIDAIQFYARYFSRVRCDVHLHKWATTSTYRSAPIALGSPPKVQPYYQIAGVTGVVRRAAGEEWPVSFPQGSKIRCDAYSPPHMADHVYDLTITNPQQELGGAPLSYGDVPVAEATAVATRVDVRVDGIWERYAAQPRGLVPKNRVSEDIQFDPVGLTMHHVVQFNVDNWRGQWAGMSGARAVLLDLGYDAPSTPLTRHFTGLALDYSFTRPSGNRSVMDVSCTNLMWIFERPIAAPPIMDGWNHYYAMSWLAQLAGLTRSQMAFAALVPDDPYSFAAGDPQPYVLPWGFGGNPWTPRDRAMSIRQMMEWVRKPLGFLLFFDAQGFLRYEKWLPSVAVPPAKVFTECPTGPDGANLSEFWNFRFRTSVREVRNQTMLMGVDQWDKGWNPIVSWHEDTASIHAVPGAEPRNFTGFPRPFVWVDSRFANTEFAAESAKRLHALLRIPEWEVQFTCWLQPQLFPMDVIGVAESRTGASAVQFYVMGVRNVWSIDAGGGVEATTTITARYLI